MSFRTLRVILVLAALTAATQLLADSDFAVSKLGPSNAAVDVDVAYSVTVTNAGPDPADVTLTDNMPVGMTFVSVVQNSGPLFSCTDPGTGNNGPITCSTATMNAFESADFTITMHIPPATQPGTVFTNTATVTTGGIDPNSENDTASTSTTAASNSADVGVSKNGPNAVPPDSDVTYTITVNNAGPFDANTVKFSDTLPGTMTFVSFTQNSGPAFTCTTGSTTSCALDPFPNGSVATFTLVGHIPPSASGSLTNTVTVTSANDSNAENDVASTTLVISSADLSIVKSGPPAATGGQQITYTLTAANGGPDTATNVQLTDVLPAGTTFASIAQNTGPAFTCSGPPVGLNGTVACSIAALASSASATFTLVLNVSNTFANGGTLTNSATISSDSGDPNPNNNTSSTSATVTGVTDVSVTKNGPATVDAGAQISWTITVQNLGANAAANTQLTDTLPAGTTFVSMTQNSGPAFNCSGTATVTCSNASFAAGATATFTLVASTTSNATGSISNTAVVSTTTADTNSGNDSSTAGTTITQHADLSVTKSGPALATVGTDMAYTITASNGGPSDAASVTLSDTLPAGTTFVSMQQNSGPAFSCSGTTTVTCSIATFTAGSSATFTLTVHVNSAASITNTATISGTTADPNSSNNSASATTAASLVDLSLTKSVSNGPYIAGQPVTFTLTVTNTGTVPATGIVVTDPLPGGMSATSTTPPGGCTGTTTVTCTAASLAAGASTSFTITANLPVVVGTYTNTATVASATTDATPANNTGSAQFAVVPPAAIPTLSQELLMLLAALLGAAAVLTLKR